LNILLTNDDGIHAPGIRALYNVLQEAGHNLWLIAPDRERSAASHSLTIRNEIRVNKIGEQEYAVSGTPVDCVVIALQKLITKPVDLVISGINAGQNMGEDIHYSGTVAAAKEAAFFGFKAIAISINSYRDQIFETAAVWMKQFLDKDIISVIEGPTVLNINIPNLPHAGVRGVRLTRTGHRKYYNFIRVTSEDESGFSYQIGGDNPVWDEHKGTDAEAIAEGYISITPLGFEMTKADVFPQILEWIEDQALLSI